MASAWSSVCSRYWPSIRSTLVKFRLVSCQTMISVIVNHNRHGWAHLTVGKAAPCLQMFPSRRKHKRTCRVFARLLIFWLIMSAARTSLPVPLPLLLSRSRPLLRPRDRSPLLLPNDSDSLDVSIVPRADQTPRRGLIQTPTVNFYSVCECQLLCMGLLCVAFRGYIVHLSFSRLTASERL